MTREIDLDTINRATWGSRESLRSYALESTWTDPGEEAAFEWVAKHCTGAPVLDIGVGAGRTVGLMRAISTDYVGVDYTPGLLDRARARFPDADLRNMDARDMSSLPSDHFALAMFSYNGIDSVDYEDRVRILSEMRRVVRPGGYLLFSSHNRHGPGYGERIWKLMPRFTPNPVRLGWRTLQSLRVLPVGIYNYLRHSRGNRDFGGYAIAVGAAHNFGIMIVYMTLAEQKRQLEALGLELDIVFGSTDAQPISPDSDSNAWWLHFIARKLVPSMPQ
ncbi:class I SAM-dependent methyltransferase [Pararobbsia silviterrae]|uniref:Class I SAM-dependent methyltransferase n=1 Tax=Pararobbsia silviterrae TaxID=1792498 RepID=A0A494X738_9BURK|nr:class I SAM-dependent methyltransferase [Pararobbsia silviterrae]RKP46250.1 class I SAM-dependent methyltransferase [Pararobbsia silviterrae]